MTRITIRIGEGVPVSTIDTPGSPSPGTARELS